MKQVSGILGKRLMRALLNEIYKSLRSQRLSLLDVQSSGTLLSAAEIPAKPILFSRWARYGNETRSRMKITTPTPRVSYNVLSADAMEAVMLYNYIDGRICTRLPRGHTPTAVETDDNMYTLVC